MRGLLEGGRVARLATIDRRGRAHVVPVVYALRGDTLYSSVDAKPKESPDLQRLRNVRADPRVTVLVDHYEEDWDRLWWVRLRGRGRVIEEGPERERALELLGHRYPQYATMPPQGAVLAVDVEQWRGWSPRPLQ